MGNEILKRTHPLRSSNIFRKSVLLLLLALFPDKEIGIDVELDAEPLIDHPLHFLKTETLLIFLKSEGSL